MNSLINRIGILSLIISLLISGCPQSAYLNIYNNTSDPLTINSSGYVVEVNPSNSVEIKFTGDDFSIKNNSDSWHYPRKVPHEGNVEPYFNGTLKLQINSDGAIYA